MPFDYARIVHRLAWDSNGAVGPAFHLRAQLGRPSEAFSYKIPFGFRHRACLLGLFRCFLTIFAGFFLPDDIDMNPIRYASYIAAGNLILISPAILLMSYNKRGHYNFAVTLPFFFLEKILSWY